MKLSEIIKAIANNEVIDDRQDSENVDVLLMIQDATDLKHIQIMGCIKGDDDRLASMVADRMVKNDDFRLMIAAASRLYLAYKICEADKAKMENSEEI